jgi:hypothetical protein
VASPEHGVTGTQAIRCNLNQKYCNCFRSDPRQATPGQAPDAFFDLVVDGSDGSTIVVRTWVRLGIASRRWGRCLTISRRRHGDRLRCRRRIVGYISAPLLDVLDKQKGEPPVEGQVCGYTGEALAVFCSTSTATEVIATIRQLASAFYPEP